MEVERGRSVERLITFTDAVVAIAITLLALPLTDISGRLVDGGLGAYVDAKGSFILGFVISFFVIARLWWAHHRLFEHVVRWDGPIVYLTMFWLLTVAVIAPATALASTNSSHDHPEVITLYIGIMTVSSALLTVTAWHVRRHPDLTDGRDTEARARFEGTLDSTVGFVFAMVIGTLFPVINYFAILVLFVMGHLGPVIRGRLRRRRA